MDNSVTSTDGRNGHNMVNINKRRFFEIYGCELSHDDVQIEAHTNKRNQKIFSANRRIATCTVRVLQSKLESENCNISLGIILELKPFFKTYPTDKELALSLQVVFKCEFAPRATYCPTKPKKTET